MGMKFIVGSALGVVIFIFQGFVQSQRKQSTLTMEPPNQNKLKFFDHQILIYFNL